MTSLAVRIATAPTTDVALDSLLAPTAEIGRVRAVVAYYGARHDPSRIRTRLAGAFPDAAIIGASSSRGVLAARHRPHPDDVGLMLIDEAVGDFGVGARRIDGDSAGAAAAALRDAVVASGCEGELPALVLVHQPPGAEEAVLEGLRRVVGDRCPIVGGSAADDDVSGAWTVLGAGHAGPDVIAVLVVFPVDDVACTFQSGYAPTRMHGVVTHALGRRIVTIDDRPAAQVYDAWRGGAVSFEIENASSLLAASAFAPLGVEMRSVAGIKQHRLIHPAKANPDGSFDTFAEVETGTRIEMMQGSIDSLSSRAGRVLSDARAALPAPERFAGALMVYCGGCAMALGEEVDRLSQRLDALAAQAPVLGIFTFGEQGMIGERCVHGNLMVSATAFSE